MFWERILRGAYRQSPLTRWSLAFLFLAIAVASRFALQPILAAEPFLTFFPAIIGAAVLCGSQPALAIMAVSAAVAWAAFMPPLWSWAWPPAAKPLAMAIYLINATFSIVLVSALLEAVRANHRLVRQQETLFRELQHRVANSLQFIASMLTLARQQATRGQDAATVLDDAATRISATGQLHRRMHDAAHYQRGLDALLHEILTDLFRDVPVEVCIEVDRVTLPLSQMTPLVLLVTEAATNALKHVFRPGLGRRFAVRLGQAGDELALAICDDGPGLRPDSPMAAEVRQSGLGLQIMKSLARQLGGQLELAGGEGLSVGVVFKRG